MNNTTRNYHYRNEETGEFTLMTEREYYEQKRADARADRLAGYSYPPPRSYRFTGDIEGSILDGDEAFMEGNF